MHARRLNARIPDAQAQQVDELCQATGQTVSEVVRTAIVRYHREITGRTGSPGAALASVGFIGCGEADPDLSSQYKHALSEDLAGKHGHR